MVPARERFHAGYAVKAEVELRLKTGLKRTSLECVVQIGLEANVVVRPVVKVGLGKRM